MAGLEGHPKPGGKLDDSTRRARVFQGGALVSLSFAVFFDLDHHTGNTLDPYEFFSLSVEAVEKFHKTGMRIQRHE